MSTVVVVMYEVVVPDHVAAIASSWPDVQANGRTLTLPNATSAQREGVWLMVKGEEGRSRAFNYDFVDTWSES